MRAKPIDPEIKEVKISRYAVKTIDGECVLFSRKDRGGVNQYCCFALK
jgi:hypothetical protein